MGSAPAAKGWRFQTTLGSTDPRNVEPDRPSGASLFFPRGETEAQNGEGARVLLPSPWRGPAPGKDQQRGGSPAWKIVRKTAQCWARPHPTPAASLPPLPTPSESGWAPGVPGVGSENSGPVLYTSREPAAVTPALSTGPQDHLTMPRCPPRAPVGSSHRDDVSTHGPLT